MAGEIRLNAEGAQLNLDELCDFTKQAQKLGVHGQEPINVRVVEGAVVFSLPVTLVHRALTGSKR